MVTSISSTLQKEVNYAKNLSLSAFQSIARKLVRQIIALQDTLDREPFLDSVQEELDSALELFCHIIRMAYKKGFPIPKITTLGSCLVRTKKDKLTDNRRMEIVSKNGQYRIMCANRNGIPTYQFVQITRPASNARLESVWFCSLSAKKPRT